MVIPDTEHQDHAGIKACSHSSEASLGLEGVGVSEYFLLLTAVLFSDRVGLGDSVDGSN